MLVFAKPKTWFIFENKNIDTGMEIGLLLCSSLMHSWFYLEFHNTHLSLLRTQCSSLSLY